MTAVLQKSTYYNRLLLSIGAIAKPAQQGISFVLAIWIAHRYGADNLGAYHYALALISGVIMPFYAGVQNAAVARSQIDPDTGIALAMNLTKAIACASLILAAYMGDAIWLAIALLIIIQKNSEIGLLLSPKGESPIRTVFMRVLPMLGVVVVIAIGSSFDISISTAILSAFLPLLGFYIWSGGRVNLFATNILTIARTKFIGLAILAAGLTRIPAMIEVTLLQKESGINAVAQYRSAASIAGALTPMLIFAAQYTFAKGKRKNGISGHIATFRNQIAVAIALAATVAIIGEWGASLAFPMISFDEISFTLLGLTLGLVIFNSIITLFLYNAGAALSVMLNITLAICAETIYLFSGVTDVSRVVEGSLIMQATLLLIQSATVWRIHETDKV